MSSNALPSLVKQLEQDIASFQAKPTQKHIGHVLEAGDGIVRASGLSKVGASEMVKFANGTFGTVLNLEEDTAGIMVLGDMRGIVEGMEVEALGRILDVPVGEKLLGRILNPL